MDTLLMTDHVWYNYTQPVVHQCLFIHVTCHDTFQTW